MILVEGMYGVLVTAPSRLVKDCACFFAYPAASTRIIVHGGGGGRIHTISVLFLDKVRRKGRQTSLTSIIYGSPRGNPITMQVPSSSSIPQTTRRMNVSQSRIRPHRRRRFFQVNQLGEDRGVPAESLGATVSTTVKKILNNRRDNLNPCRSPCSTWNQSE